MRWRCRRDDEAGAVTAELAVAVPAVVLVLAACLGGLRIGLERLRVVDEAAQSARLAARGDPAPLPVARRGDLMCATAEAEVPLLGLPVPVRATSCALGPAVP